MSSRIRAWLFDFDGTLTDNSSVCEGFLEVLAGLSHPLARHALSARPCRRGLEVEHRQRQATRSSQRIRTAAPSGRQQDLADDQAGAAPVNDRRSSSMSAMNAAASTRAPQRRRKARPLRRSAAPPWRTRPARTTVTVTAVGEVVRQHRDLGDRNQQRAQAEDDQRITGRKIRPAPAGVARSGT